MKNNDILNIKSIKDFETISFQNENDLKTSPTLNLNSDPIFIEKSQASAENSFLIHITPEKKLFNITGNKLRFSEGASITHDCDQLRFDYKVNYFFRTLSKNNSEDIKVTNANEDSAKFSMNLD